MADEKQKYGQQKLLEANYYNLLEITINLFIKNIGEKRVADYTL